MFEYCLIYKYEVFLQSSDQQFGFKKKLGCTHAIFALNQCVDYFVNSGSSVFLAALDATKVGLPDIPYFTGAPVFQP